MRMGSTSYRELLIGCGRKRGKKFNLQGRQGWTDLTTLDINPDHEPDVVHDLQVLPYPFPTSHFDEIHAYEVMEHIGRQGDWRSFFAQWSEIHRLLKPGGYFIGTSPNWNSPWAWGDPGHTRIIGQQQLQYLSQKNYEEQVGKTAMTDYRFCYKADLTLEQFSPLGDHQSVYVLKAHK